MNIKDKIENKLPPPLVGFLQLIGKYAADRNEKTYLVGGVVRDLLLDKPNFDIDITVEGDAIAFALDMMDNDPSKVTVHRQFNTAKVKWHDWTIDFATSRSEKYACPGALPAVSPDTIENDLRRRDFTVNAMAAGLTGKNYGCLYDPYNGQTDLRDKNIRVLHEKSFIDDPTRIWRALRYEQRLGFCIEPHTLELLKRDIPMLSNISGERIRYEVECILKEDYPEKVFKRASMLGLGDKLSTSVKTDMWLNERFSQAREMSYPHRPSPVIYWALLTYEMDITEKENLISYLRLPKPVAQTIRDCDSVKKRLKYLAVPNITNSEVYHLLYGYSLQAITANIIATGIEDSRASLVLYAEKLHSIKPTLTGNDLLKMGITQGPVIKDILNTILDDRLNEKAKTREDEIKIVRGILAK